MNRYYRISLSAVVLLVFMLLVLSSATGCSSKKETAPPKSPADVLAEEYREFLAGEVPCSKFNWDETEWADLAASSLTTGSTNPESDPHYAYFIISIKNDFSVRIPEINVFIKVFQQDGDLVGTTQETILNLLVGETEELYFGDFKHDIYDTDYSVEYSLSVAHFIPAEVYPESTIADLEHISIQTAKAADIPLADKLGSSGETIGYFERVEWGDYCHFVITDLDGETQSYLVYRRYNDEIDINRYETDESLVGQKVKVKWQAIETYIPEGGGYYPFDELLDIEVLE